MSLSAIFLAALDDDRRDLTAIEGLEARLEAVVRAARDAWPTIDVEIHEFLPFLATRVAPSSDAAEEPFDPLRAADIYLACACSHANASAIELFDREYIRPLDPVLQSAGVAAHDVDEVKQQLRETLFVGATDAPKIASYRARGPLSHWFRIVAVRHAQRWRGAQRKESSLLDTLTSSIGLGRDAGVDHIHRVYGDHFRDALAAGIEALEPDDRDVLRQVIVDELSAAELADRLGVHRTTAVRRLDRVQRDLRDSVRSHLVRALAIDRFEADSVLRLYDSGFELSLQAFLRDA